MSRRKKKQTAAGQRRQDEIQKRIQKANENAEKKKSGGPGPRQPDNAKTAPETIKEPVPAPAAEERPARKPERRKASRPQPRQPIVPSRKSLVIDMADTAPGELSAVTFPARMTVESLLKTIRTDYPMSEGHLYIHLDGADPVPGGHALSYAYQKGLFTRQETLSGKKTRTAPPVLAELLDARIVKICAERSGPEAIDWHASAIADNACPDGNQ